MLERQIWDGRVVPALGLGCWAIGGTMLGGETSFAWGDVNDDQSRDAIRRGIDAGIRFFDTAAAYGCGHSETLLGEVIGNRDDIVVCTKAGYEIDTETRQMLGEDASSAAIRRGVEGSLRRLRRDRIDLALLHLNELPVDRAAVVFDTFDTMRAEGKIDRYGWSTDFPERAEAFAGRPGFVAVEHAMNVLFRASAILPVIEAAGLLSLNRSPLAMGMLTGKYGRDSRFAAGDVRALNLDWMAYFRDGAPAPEVLRQIDAVRDLLTTGGRSLAQGAIGWLWARSGAAIPLPGFKSAEQVRDCAGALAFGPLPEATMDEIERVIDRAPEGPPRSR